MMWLMSGHFCKVQVNSPAVQAKYPQIAIIEAIMIMVPWMTVVNERGRSPLADTAATVLFCYFFVWQQLSLHAVELPVLIMRGKLSGMITG